MFGAEFDPVRFVFFLIVGPPLLAWLLLMKSDVLRMLILVAVLILIQDSFSYRRYVWFVGIGPAVILGYVAFLALYLRRAALPPLGGYLPLWIALLFLGMAGLLIGSFGTGLLPLNFFAFQEFYLEGLLFFVVGMMAFDRDEKVERFFTLFPGIAVGVAFLHYYFLATGTRIRSFAGEADQVVYGGVFSNPNNLGAFYAMAIPIALLVAIRGRAHPILRLLAIGAIPVMTGSLLLAGSRGGFASTGAMVIVALLWSRLGLARAAFAALVGAAVALGGYGAVSMLFPELLGEVFGLLAEEGLETHRLTVWGRFLRLIASNPLGVGLSSDNMQPYADAYELYVANAHNVYLDFASKSGVLSLLVFLAIVGSIVLRNWRALGAATDPSRRQALIILFVAMSGFLTAGLVEPVYHNCYQLAQFFWLCCGMSLAASRRDAPATAAARARAAYGPGLSAAAGDPRTAP